MGGLLERGAREFVAATADPALDVRLTIRWSRKPRSPSWPWLTRGGPGRRRAKPTEAQMGSAGSPAKRTASCGTASRTPAMT